MFRSFLSTTHAIRRVAIPSICSAFGPVSGPSFINAWSVESELSPLVRGLKFRKKLKTNKSVAARWRSITFGFKRKQAGRKHGNVGWSRRRVLKGLDETRTATTKGPAKIAKLKRLLPYHNMKHL